MGVRLDLAERLPAVLLRHPEVEQDEVGPRRRERVPEREVVEELLAVAHEAETAREAALLEGAPDDGPVVRVVLGAQDLERPRVRQHGQALGAFGRSTTWNQ